MPITTSTSPLLRERVYAQIRLMAMLGEFPTGKRLAEEQIAGQLEVSRTPVREAFVRLHADRILHRYEDGGYYVAEIDLQGLRDLYEARLTLELHGIARVHKDGVHHDRQQLLELRDAWLAIKDAPPAPDGSFIELDEEFHVDLLRASGNEVLTELLDDVNVRIRPVRIYDFLSAERIETSINEHLAIVDAVIADDLEHAAAALRQHIGASLDIVEQHAVDVIHQRATRGKRLTSKGTA